MKTIPFDAYRYLDSEEAIAEYISQVMAEQDDNLLLAALNDIARARGMTRLARDTGLSREALYRSLEQGAKPRFDTIQRIMRGLGIQISAVPLSPNQETETA